MPLHVSIFQQWSEHGDMRATMSAFIDVHVCLEKEGACEAALSFTSFPFHLGHLWALTPFLALSLFQVFSTRAIVPQATPGDRATRLCLSHRPPIRKLLDSYEELRGGLGHQPLRSCLCAEHEKQEEAKSCCGKKKKKKVVFADMKGFSLTAVRIFSKIEEDLCDLHHVLSNLTSFRNKCRGPGLEMKKYVLDFSPPSADYSAFRSRLQSSFVSLESCVIQEKSLSGTIKVRNISYEKEVYVRITFDSWKTFQNISCQYMHNTYGYTDTDAFSFEVALPKTPVPCGSTEFCISFHCGTKVYWDNNQGENYRIRQVAASSPPGALSRLAKSTLRRVRPPPGTSQTRLWNYSRTELPAVRGSRGPYW
ncbi:protein phosphatase 1 regulatory subunit 3C-like [Sphaerodactylus townsendi]|uniref:protein phosphatase 1 regulatory subunit 3C-like n=1 Tax=Sphaerodactylus townsendi TaxID=933632 RepID=UPI002026506D|nr:protein phosphatase 1 regulatory subunit 3C-like [Sphaerodactylus townsendi]